MSITPIHREAAVVGRERVYAEAARVAFWGLGVNGVLVVAKLSVGIVTGSSALVADAVNSIGDVASALAVRGALGVAQIEEDDDHPYGHSKAESIAGLCVALLVTFSAGLLAIETIQKLGGPLRVPSVVAGVVAAVCGIVKEASYQFTRRAAARLHSSSLNAAAWDHRSDAIGSGLVAVSLLVAPYCGSAAPWIDPIAAMLVCTVLVFTGGRIFASAARELMDQQADDATLQQVRAIAETVDRVEEVEKLRVRKSGLEYFVEIHVEVDGQMSVESGHRIGHRVKDDLMRQLPRIRDVHVHIEPHASDSSSSPRN